MNNLNSTQIHDSHPILADYGDDQCSIRINDKGNDYYCRTFRLIFI